MKCERCGKNVPFRSKVCPNCGKDNPNYNPWSSAGNASSPEQPMKEQQVDNNSNGNTATVQQKDKPITTKKKFSFKTLLILALVIVAVIFLFNKCNADKLKGTWVAGDGSIITFSDSENGYISDGSSSRTLDFTYFIDDDVVEIKTKTTLFHNSKIIRYEFEISGDTLTLKDLDNGQIETFRKE